MSIPFNGFLLLLTAVTFPVYLSVLVTIVCRRTLLHSSFYSIFLSVGIADLSMNLGPLVFRYIPSYLWHYWPTSRPYIQSTIFHTMHNMVFGWGLYFASVSGIVVLSRVAALSNLSPWTTKTTKMAIVFQWLWVLPFGVPQLFPCCHSVLASNATFRSTFANPQITSYFWLGDVIVECFLAAPSLIVMHLVMSVKVIQCRKSVAPLGAQASNQGMEQRFALLGAVLCISYILIVCNYILYFLNNGIEFFAFQTFFLSFVHKFFVNANPFLLLILSPTFRNMYFEFMSRKRNASGS